uniref:Transposase n=1 Tax=Heterorhabditis bacteriophora TaxID=37862 RepID=A0A1I7X658_HETBA
MERQQPFSAKAKIAIPTSNRTNEKKDSKFQAYIAGFD